MKKGDYVKLQKISDDRFDGRHPNFIDVGHTVYGRVLEDLEVAKRFRLVDVKGDSNCYFYTSNVLKIIDENTFITLNSTYKVSLFDTSFNNNALVEFEGVLDNDN